MERFYFTFMQKQAFKNKYVIVQAVDEPQARTAMFEHFGDKWMTSYSHEKFIGEDQPRQFNLTPLCFLAVINHGSEEYPSLEYIMIGEE